MCHETNARQRPTTLKTVKVQSRDMRKNKKQKKNT